MAVATAAALAVGAAGWAYPHSHEVALASVEVERGQPSVTGEAPAETVGAPAAEEPAAQAGDPPVTGNPLWAIPMSKLSATRDRPLFSASRRPRTPTVAAAPSPQPVAVATSPAPEPPHLTLVGTIIGENSRIAIFFDENAKTSSGVREGEAVAGWMLRTVDSHSAVLEASGRTATLDLPEPGVQQAPPPRVSAITRKRRFIPGNPIIPGNPPNNL